MWTTLIFTLLVSAACSLDPLSQEFIDHINSLNTTWKAGKNFGANARLSCLKKMLGALPDGEKRILPERGYDILIPDAAIPENFDSREQWPNCPTIKEIGDQASCGSCWAFGATEAMSDRLCIHSNGEQIFRFSVEDLLSCCSDCSYGCDGGYPTLAWRYWVNSGIVSGGQYGSNQGCRPYSIGYFKDHVIGLKTDCTIEGVPVPECVRQCREGYDVPYEQDLHYGTSAYYVTSTETEMQKEIMTNGPVETLFVVYEDFYSYKSGVYKHVTGAQTGNHAVKILGWGVENNTPYWLAANSWNQYWGDHGFFKILRGSNECGFENQINAGMPKL